MEMTPEEFRLLQSAVSSNYKNAEVRLNFCAHKAGFDPSEENERSLNVARIVFDKASKALELINI